MIPYVPEFYSKTEADALFEFCKLLQHKRMPNGHWGHSLKRRLSYPCWTVPHESKRKADYGDRLPLEDAPALYLELAARLSAFAGKQVNCLSTIGYENAHDGMNWHQHKEDHVREDQTVWVLSLGDEHLIGLREKGDENKDNWECFYPAHGSLYVLPSAFNTTHEHAVLPDKFSRGLRIGINCKHFPVQTTPQIRWGSKADYPDAVYVGRKNTRGKFAYPDTPFGNHLKLSPLAKFRAYALDKMKDAEFAAQVELLRGKDLLCPWCKHEDPNCHARVWLELANI